MLFDVLSFTKVFLREADTFNQDMKLIDPHWVHGIPIVMLGSRAMLNVKDSYFSLTSDNGNNLYAVDQVGRISWLLAV